MAIRVRQFIVLSNPPPVRIAIVSPQEIVARGIVSMLADYPDRVVVTTLPGTRSRAKGVHVILYDTMGLRSGDDSELRHLIEATDAELLVLSRDMRPDLRARALAMGAVAWVSMSIRSRELVDAVEIVAAGRQLPEAEESLGADVELTQREVEIVALIAQGLSNADIATQLYLSENTLKSHVRSSYRKIGAASRSQAVIWALQHGFAPPEPIGVPHPQG